MASSSARTYWLIGLTAAVVFALGQLVPGLRTRLETIPYDRMARAISATAPESRVVLVHVDAPSIERLGDPPWPADVHATLINRLHAAGARVIGFTQATTPTSSDRERMRAALRLIESADVNSNDERQRLRALLAESNAGAGDMGTLARAMRNSGRVVIPLTLTHTDDGTGSDLVPGDARIIVNSDLLHAARQFQSIEAPPDVLLKSAAAAGHAGVIADVDGIVRRDYTAVRVGTVLVPSLATAIAATALQVPLDKIRFTDQRALRLGTYSFPLEPQFASLLHPLRAANVTTLSYQQVLESDQSTIEAVRDAVVIVQPTSAASASSVITSLG